MKRIAVFPGSFDPVTLGHQDIVRRALPLFDEIIVALGINTSKKYLFPLEKRLEYVTKSFSFSDKIRVDSIKGLTVDYCKNNGAQFILRGLRNTVDFNFEKNIADMNRTLSNEVESIFILTSPELAAINSSIVRELIKNKADVSAFIPKEININD